MDYEKAMAWAAKAKNNELTMTDIGLAFEVACTLSNYLLECKSCAKPAMESVSQKKDTSVDVATA